MYFLFRVITEQYEKNAVICEMYMHIFFKMDDSLMDCYCAIRQLLQQQDFKILKTYCLADIIFIKSAVLLLLKFTTTRLLRVKFKVMQNA